MSKRNPSEPEIRRAVSKGYRKSRAEDEATNPSGRDSSEERNGELVQESKAKGQKANPPRTTTDGWLTAPKFGSAGSGGAELEPGPESD